MSLLWFLSPREEEGRPQEKPRKTGECLPGPRAVGAWVAPLQPLGALAQPAANQQPPRQVPTRLGLQLPIAGDTVLHDSPVALRSSL